MTEAERHAALLEIQDRLSVAKQTIAAATGQLQTIRRDLVATADLIECSFQDRQALETAQVPAGFDRAQRLLNELRLAMKERDECQRLLELARG